MILCDKPYIEFRLGDCLDLMPSIPDKSIDMILADLPYGTTTCHWDSVLPLDKLWNEYERMIKNNGAIVLFGSEPFSTYLRMSNIKLYRYDIIWDKIRGSNFALANKQPLKTHENISIFYKKLPKYNPQMEVGKPYDKTKYNGAIDESNITGHKIIRTRKKNNGERFPTSILKFSMNWRRQKQLHPTQKPVALFEYLIKTYTNEEAIVLDNVAGSGTTGIACYNTNRNAILMEKDKPIFEMACRRISDHVK